MQGPSTPEQYAADLERFGTPTAVARHHRMPRTTLLNRINAWEMQGHRFVHSEPAQAATALVTPPPARPAEPAELLAMQRRLERAEATATSLKAQLKIAAKHANVVEDVRDLLAPVIAACVIPRPTAVPKANRSKMRKPLTAVWHLTDLHFDEILEANTMNGVNAYSPEIAAARVQHTFDTILALASNY